MTLKHVFDQHSHKGIIGKTMVVQGYEELTETTRTLTFHIATGNTGGNESQKLNPGEPTRRVRVTVNLCDNYC